jgi:hypothetical protein
MCGEARDCASAAEKLLSLFLRIFIGIVKKSNMMVLDGGRPKKPEE